MILLTSKKKKKKKRKNPTENIYVGKNRKLNVFVVLITIFSLNDYMKIFEVFYFSQICNSYVIAFGLEIVSDHTCFIDGRE